MTHNYNYTNMCSKNKTLQIIPQKTNEFIEKELKDKGLEKPKLIRTSAVRLDNLSNYRPKSK